MTFTDSVQLSEENERLRTRLRRLAEDKSNLQLVIRLIEQLNPLPGMENMLRDMLYSIVETIGGTNIKLYYFVEGALHYLDFLGEQSILPTFDDPLVAQVASSLEFIEEYSDAESALMQGEVIPGAWTWGFPLLVGNELIGVIKLENLNLSGASLRNFLPIFFSHAALILSNEIRNELRKKAETALAQSAELFKTISDTSPLAIYMSRGIEQRADYINPTFTRLFGYTLAEAPTAAEWWPLAYPDESYRRQITGEWQRRVEQAIASRSEIKPMEVVVTCKDHTKKFISWRFVSTGTQNWSFGLDLTERKQAEEALRRERDLSDNLINTAQAIILVLDTQGNILRYNHYLENLSGYPLSEMQGRNWVENFLPEKERLRIRALFETATAGQKTQGTINVILTRSGEERLIEWYDKTITDTAGNIVGLLAVGQDVTQRIETEKELTHYKDHLEEEVRLRTSELLLTRDAAEAANRAKSLFLANMSHELRTPLNAILGFSSLMRKDEQLRVDQRTNLDIINRSGEHLLTLINDVLEMAKIEAGRVQLENAPFDLGGMVRDVVDMMEIRAQEKGLHLLLDQSSEFPRHIVGDEARLRQILINLVGNAVKFTQEGGVTLRLGTFRNKISHLIIEIEDSGVGISEEDQQRLFHPFTQFGKKAGDNQGTGLGLSITRQFVELMGGSIIVESNPGKGSVFRVELPLEEANAMDIEQHKTLSTGEIIGLEPGQASFRILIVEDQLENQLLLSQLMSRIGLAVQVAENGEQAVQLFISDQPHLIWMDRRLPGMDGIETTRRIRELPGGKDVKIIAVTASAFMEQRQEMLVAGMDDFVRKPYRFNEIYQALERQLGVRYTYAETLDSKEPIAPVVLTPAMLVILPPELRNELHNALESLDSECIADVLRKVEAFDAMLYKTLAHLVDNFDYPAILYTLQQDANQSI